MTQRSFLAWTGGGLTAAVIGAAALYGLYLRYEPDADAWPVGGIDVSHHQGAIDWAKLAADGADFAYVKATEGGDFRDTRFRENWDGAAAAGIVRGAYHFFTLCRPGRDQAQHFIDVVADAPGTLPPAVDPELGGNCAERRPRTVLLHELGIFLATVAAHYGRKPVIYTTAAFHDAYLDGAFSNHPFWLRSLVLEPSFDGRAWTFWQFHDCGRRSGIDGPVDLNVFRGDDTAFQRLIDRLRPRSGEATPTAKAVGHGTSPIYTVRTYDLECGDSATWRRNPDESLEPTLRGIYAETRVVMLLVGRNGGWPLTIEETVGPAARLGRCVLMSGTGLRAASPPQRDKDYER